MQQLEGIQGRVVGRLAELNLQLGAARGDGPDLPWAPCVSVLGLGSKTQPDISPCPVQLSYLAGTEAEQAGA